MLKTLKDMKKGMRNSNTKKKGDRFSIYLDPESLEWFEHIQKQWNMERSQTMQTILKMWKKMVILLEKGLLQDENGLGELITNVLKVNENKEKKET